MKARYVLEKVGLNNPTKIRCISDHGAGRTLETRLLDIGQTVSEWLRYFCESLPIIVEIDKALYDRISSRSFEWSKSVRHFFEDQGVVFTVIEDEGSKTGLKVNEGIAFALCHGSEGHKLAGCDIVENIKDYLDKKDKEIKQLRDRLEKSIESPCAVGDTLYKVYKNGKEKIVPAVVEEIVVTSKGIRLKLSCNYRYRTSVDAIGESLFRSFPEAEEKLKEIEKSDCLNCKVVDCANRGGGE